MDDIRDSDGDGGADHSALDRRHRGHRVIVSVQPSPYVFTIIPPYRCPRSRQRSELRLTGSLPESREGGGCEKDGEERRGPDVPGTHREAPSCEAP